MKRVVAWSEKSLKTALEQMTFQNKSLKETHGHFPSLSKQTIYRRFLLIKYGVPIEIASRKILKASDYAQYLSDGLTNMFDVEEFEKKVRQGNDDSFSVKTESDNGYGDSNPETEGESDRKFCSVPFCLSDSDKEPNLTFFGLPVSINMTRLWAKRCGKPEWAEPAKVHFAKKHTLVCAHHFAESMFVDEDRTELKANAMPSLGLRGSPKGSGRSMVMDHNGQVRGIIEPDPLEVDPLAIDSADDPNRDANPPEEMETERDPEGDADFNGFSITTITHFLDPNVDTLPPIDMETDTASVVKKRHSRLKSLTDSELKQKNDKIKEINEKNSIQLKDEKLTPTPSKLTKILKVNLGPQASTPKTATSRTTPCLAANCTKLADGGYYTCRSCRDDGYVACAIRSCRRVFNSKKNKTSYVYFPVQKDLRIKWLKAIGKPYNWKSDEGIICVRHFRKPEDYVSDALGLTLKLNAVPSIAIGLPKKTSVALKSRVLNKSRNRISSNVPKIIIKKIVSRKTRSTAQVSTYSVSNPETAATSAPPAPTSPTNNIQKPKMTFARKKMLLSLQRMRLLNENLKLKNDKLRLENTLLERQL